MPKLNSYEMGHLTSALAGMAGGRTLFDDRLIVRKDTMEYAFHLTAIIDTSRTECHCCRTPLPGAVAHWGEQILRIQGLPDNIQRIPLCYDCAVPQ